MIDFHTHILPGIDDGSSSEKISVMLLKKLREQGVSKVLLTPHFYAYSSNAENFFENRKSSAQRLLRALENDGVDVELYLGCEILYFDDIWRLEKIKDFCIAGTEYLLLEMPFSSWTDNMVSVVEKLIGKGIVPVIAHFERYIKYKGNEEKICTLTELGVLLQMNCSYIGKFLSRRKAIRYIKSGAVFALGTDTHNLDSRAPDYSTAIRYLGKKFSDKQIKGLFSGAQRALENAEKIY